MKENLAAEDEVYQNPSSLPQSSPTMEEGTAQVEIVTASLISQVKDLLPHLGEEFIKVRFSSNKRQEWHIEIYID